MPQGFLIRHIHILSSIERKYGHQQGIISQENKKIKSVWQGRVAAGTTGKTAKAILKPLIAIP